MQQLGLRAETAQDVRDMHTLRTVRMALRQQESEYSWMVDVDDVDLPCGGYGYEHRSDGLAERYERLAQVAMQMRDWLFYYVETDPGHVVVESDQDEVREIREAFDALGVSVDD